MFEINVKRYWKVLQKSPKMLINMFFVLWLVLNRLLIFWDWKTDSTNFFSFRMYGQSRWKRLQLWIFLLSWIKSFQCRRQILFWSLLHQAGGEICRTNRHCLRPKCLNHPLLTYRYLPLKNYYEKFPPFSASCLKLLQLPLRPPLDPPRVHQLEELLP